MERDAKGRFVSKEDNTLLRNVPKRVDWLETANEFERIDRIAQLWCFLHTCTRNDGDSIEVCSGWDCAHCCFCTNHTEHFSKNDKINAFVKLCEKHGVYLEQDAAGHWSVTKAKNKNTKKAEAALLEIDWPYIVVQALLPSLSEPGDYSFAACCFARMAGGVDVSFDAEHNVWVARRGGLEGRSTSADVAVCNLMRACASADSMTKEEA